MLNHGIQTRTLEHKTFVKRIASTLVLTSCIWGLGCNSTTNIPVRQISALEGQIRAVKYTPFRPLRSTDGAGTIVEFNWHGEESRLAAATNCLVIGTNQIHRDYTAILDTVYTNRNSGGLEFDLGKLFEPQLTLAATFTNSNVKEVKIKLHNPFEEYIYYLPTKGALNALPTNSDCRDLLKNNKGCLLLHSVLGAEGVEYEFIGSDGRTLSLTATILKQINVKPEHRSDYEGKSSLNFQKEILLGYRAWRPKKLSGFWYGTFDFKELSPEEVEDLRSTARPK
jgi:hypothetical protein